MESPNKRRKPNEENIQHNEEEHFAQNGTIEHRHGWNQESNRFNGQGISNHHGNVNIGREMIGIVDSLQGVAAIC